ncbi:hypothetical protein [Streptomyces sp. enrichment culture]|uniref:hypothetical protein n=1 Tax=Streptomyces sp. enrichment culture TaxID=1795815 RepID=UPI003F56AA7E
MQDTGLDRGEDLAGRVSLEASDGLTSGLALLGASFVVQLGTGVVAQAVEEDAVQGGIGLAVAAVVESACAPSASMNPAAVRSRQARS